uniref:BFN domain-containing protein n=1 Tax=Setaria italica TaxID=4555 RepID=K3XLQ7_SETIT
MEIINGSVLPRYAAPAAGALTSDARISGHLQLLRRVRLRGRACGLQADCDNMPRRFFGPPSPRRHGRSDWGDWPVRCSYGSSSDGDGAAAANFDASGEEFVDSTVIEAVELRSVSDGFEIKMRDGKNLRCVQNNPRVLRLRDSAPHHAIVLKMEDGSDLLLPIIVSMYQFLLGCISHRCRYFSDFLVCPCYFLQWKHQALCCWLHFGTFEFQGQLFTMCYWR